VRHGRRPFTRGEQREPERALLRVGAAHGRLAACLHEWSPKGGLRQLYLESRRLEPQLGIVTNAEEVAQDPASQLGRRLLAFCRFVEEPQGGQGLAVDAVSFEDFNQLPGPDARSA
jgi:hypothetical protein